MTVDPETPVPGQGNTGGGTPAPPAKTKPYKAYAGFVVTFIVLVGQALDPGADHHPVSVSEWIVTFVGALATAAVVYGVTNPAIRKAARSRLQGP